MARDFIDIRANLTSFEARRAEQNRLERVFTRLNRQAITEAADLSAARVACLNCAKTDYKNGELSETFEEAWKDYARMALVGVLKDRATVSLLGEKVQRLFGYHADFRCGFNPRHGLSISLESKDTAPEVQARLDDAASTTQKRKEEHMEAIL